MGATRIRCIMKTCVILAIVAVAFSADSFSEDFSDEISFIQDEPDETLASAVHELRSAAPELLQAHVDHIAKHAELIQSHSMSSKAKAYAHNFAASQRAIKAALKSLNDQLAAGHSHDKNALNTARANAGTLLANVKSKSKAAVNNYRGKACPSKRAEESANAKKAAAKSKLDKEKNTKICTLATTWGDMDIDKSTPKFGSALRNGWDQARSKWLKAKAAWDAAVKAHNTAIANHNKAMASFTTAVKIEATNTVNQCNNGHKEYNILKNEVASNVRTRKATFIATLVIACYIDNVASNSAAKACADKQRKASVSQWNITPAALAACSSSASPQQRHATFTSSQSAMPRLRQPKRRRMQRRLQQRRRKRMTRQLLARRGLIRMRRSPRSSPARRSTLRRSPTRLCSGSPVTHGMAGSTTGMATWAGTLAVPLLSVVSTPPTITAVRTVCSSPW